MAFWISLSLVSALFTSLRHLYIKDRCRAIEPVLLIGITRMAGTVVLAPFLFLSRDLTIKQPALFSGVLLFTALATAAATILQIGVIQKHPISRTVPLLTFIPIFMIPWTVVLLGEYPNFFGLIGILITCAGAYLLHMRGARNPLVPLRTLMTTRSSVIMLLVALVLGATTTCDKIAIEAADAFTYVFIWTAVSSVVMAIIAVKMYTVKDMMRSLAGPHPYVQSALWAAGFMAQMAAIEQAISISSGVTYVKMLTMFNVIITVVVGGTIFREGHLLRSLAASVLMIVGAILVVATA